MKIELPFLGRTKERYLEEGINDFYSRLSHYVSVSIKPIKVRTPKGKTVEQAIRSESSLLDQNIDAGSYRIALDSHGISVNSEELCDLLVSLENQSVKKVVFIIGGPAGLAAEQLKKADRVIALSRMTFTHDMARLFLLEQLYRAYTIKAGEKYHK